MINCTVLHSENTRSVSPTNSKLWSLGDKRYKTSEMGDDEADWWFSHWALWTCVASQWVSFCDAVGTLHMFADFISFSSFHFCQKKGVILVMNMSVTYTTRQELLKCWLSFSLTDEPRGDSQGRANIHHCGFERSQRFRSVSQKVFFQSEGNRFRGTVL